MNFKTCLILFLLLGVAFPQEEQEEPNPLGDMERIRNDVNTSDNWVEIEENLKRYDMYVYQRQYNSIDPKFVKYMKGDVGRFMRFMDLDRDGYIIKEECDTAVFIGMYPAEFDHNYCMVIFDGRLFDKNLDDRVDPSEVKRKKYGFMGMIYEIKRRQREAEAELMD